MRQTILLVALIALARAQAPTGTIAGVVRDPSGAAVAAARVKLMNLATGWVRTTDSSEQGAYGFPSLLAGEYELSVEASGFQRVARAASVEAGATTTADFSLRLGEVSESITVDGASPQIRYDSHAVGGLVARGQIEGLPLNGRSFLELAKLEPGVQAPSRASSNRTFVPVLGAPGGNNGRATRVTVDGGSIMAVGNGGSAMGFSQEVVQEFHTATVNLDLTTGLTFAGAINVVTRSGGNDLHGDAFYFFRDHNLAAHPALSRDPANPDPFYQRRQYGLAVGGPIRRERAFFFANWERNEQRGVVATTLGGDFAHLSRITPSPLFGNQASLRLDHRLTNAHTAFLRYSHEGGRAFGPLTNQANAYPSTWSRQPVWADQSMLGLTSVLSPTLVNDLRVSYFFVSSSQVAPRGQDCAGCLGIDAPALTVQGTGLSIGYSGQQHTLGRRFHLSDSVTWQRSTHRARFGVDWEYNRGGTLNWNNEPATITLFSPDQVRTFNAQTPAELRIPLPVAFNNLSDVLRLPLQSFVVGIGDPRAPQAHGGTTRTWNTARLFFQDTWRLRQSLTVNYGLGWSIDRNLNYDLSKPALLAPILGADGLGPTRKEWKNFSPVLGLAWAPSRDGKTVVRAGAGIFYDFLFGPNLDNERALLGPPGLGRRNIPGSAIANTLPDIPGVPVGRALNFTGSPTLFTGDHLMKSLSDIRASQLQSRVNADRSVRTIQIDKQSATALYPVEAPTSSAQHVNVGVQRQMARDFVVSADFAYRHFVHLGLGGLDLNRFNSIRGPVLPVCTAAQRDDPLALCSTGQIRVQVSAGRASYKGILLRADKRFSHGFQALGSYAFSSNTGTTGTGNGFNLDNWLEANGPLSTDYTHIANLGGVARLPWRLEVGFNFSYSSAAPFSAFVGGNDFNGDGTTGDLLPGTSVLGFNRGLGRADLEPLVGEFNGTYRGARDAQGRAIPRLTLPDRYAFGDSFNSLDLRLSRSFGLREHWRLTLLGEVFNLYNNANLTGFSGDLTSALFGQPTGRFTQVFGSGGPRAFQLAMKVGF